MNFQCSPRLPCIRVLMVNPLVPSTQMVIAKIMSGVIFGLEQDVELTLLVYANEMERAEQFKAELCTLAFGCVSKIHISSNLPKITDADVFCFMTNFKNPNKFMPETFVEDDQFDVLYLLLKIANSFTPASHPLETKIDENKIMEKEKDNNNKSKRKPIIVADGIVTLDILKSMSKDIPSDVFFCSTPIEALSDIVLGDFLRVKTHEINDKCIWAANHEVFHVEFNRPLITTQTEDPEKISGRSCLMGPCGRPNLDYVQFNETWMKKNFTQSVLDLSVKNPYGRIYKASEFSATLTAIWAGRKSKTPLCINAGVISDGALDTFKDYAYVLPIEITGESWKVSEKFKDDPQLRLEINRINKVVRHNRYELVEFCKKFLIENVVKLQFMPMYEQSLSTYSFSETSEENLVY